MSRCAQCGADLYAGELCLVHDALVSDDFAVTNRLACALVHRPEAGPPGGTEQ